MKKKKIISFDTSLNKIAAIANITASVACSISCAVMAAQNNIQFAIVTGAFAVANVYIASINSNFNARALKDRAMPFVKSFLKVGKETNEKENNNINSL